MADETFSTDYLGSRVPLSLSGKPALPVSGAPAGAAAGPSLPAGAGVAVPGGAGGIDGSGGLVTGAQGAFPVDTSGPSAGAILKGGAKLADIAGKFLPSTPTGSFELSPETQAAWDAYRAGERGDFGSLAGFGSAEVLPQVSGGELALGSEGGFLNDAAGLAGTAGNAASFGASVAPSFGAFTSALGAAAPVWALLTAVVDFLGEGKFPGEDILNSIFGFNNPSKEWVSFPGRLAKDLGDREAANKDLALALSTASEPEIQRAISSWQARVGPTMGGVPGGAGPLDIFDLPGAGHSGGEGGHEGGGRLATDFSPEVFGLREMLTAAMSGATPEDRIAALMRGLEGRRGTLAEEKAARDAEQARIYGTPEEQSQAAILSGAGGGA